ncbi:CCR4-Not complex component, Not1-domain-containing protein [Coniochaeta sp. 2T2.1]|nr:CCR4-Not complex component, Not1-domain-containing protein [Coniochaeta sp. 2T2.1]
MVSHSRAATFSPNPTLQTVHSGSSYSPHPSQAGASPSTHSPTGSNTLKIVVAQVYLLLSTIKDDKDDKLQQLRKLIDENGMEAFSKYFARLVSGNASQIFPGFTRSTPNQGGNTYSILLSEMRKLSVEPEQARRIAESIETGNEDIFRDFDLSTFMEHFRLDALEKTILALAFKLGPRSDLKTKADAILSTNFPTFVSILRRIDDGDHKDMSPDFVAEIIDRFIQLHPPNFNTAAKSELRHNVQARYANLEAPPTQVLATLDLMRVLGDRPPNALALYINRTGPDFTASEAKCAAYLENRPGSNPPSEEQVSVALMYTTISQTQRHNPSVLVAALRKFLPSSFRWQDVVSYFDVRDLRISSSQFLRLYNALLPVAKDPGADFDIQRLYAGEWDNHDTQLSFICAYSSLTPDELDASTIPGLVPTIRLEDYANAAPAIRERAAYAVRHPLVSAAALTAVFSVALASQHVSQGVEAKRLFQTVVLPYMDIFVVSAIGIPKPSWPVMAVDTVNSLFDTFLAKQAPHYDFVLESLWNKDKDWVKQRLVDAHVSRPMDLPVFLDHAIDHGWLDELVYLPNGFGLDLTALAHSRGHLNLQEWSHRNAELRQDVSGPLLQFLLIKAGLEQEYQSAPDGQPNIRGTALQVRTVSALLEILDEHLAKPTPPPELTFLQRRCISAYPRLVNYGEGYDDIIDANGRDGNALPPAAIARMEDHYKKMYGDEVEVRDVVLILKKYKESRDPLEQDVFASMIQGLLDEYNHYIGYPLEALATTAVLFGGIISHKLVSKLPLTVGLGMILESVRDHEPHESMYKFGLQALMQLFGRLPEWPDYCKLLVQIPGLVRTEAYKQAEAVVRAETETMPRSLHNGTGALGHAPGLGDNLTNGKLEDGISSETHLPPFTSVNVDPPPPGILYEDPGDDAQGRIQFVLNNLTETTLQPMFKDLRELLEEKHQQWFASHLVEERAKMQPNYHQVYLDLVKQFGDKALWAEVLRETFVSVQRMLNSEITLQNSTDRSHLKNLGAWLGLLTLARDKPIRHRNIAFKDLLTEAYDTKRLIVVIPFVCKVLMQGAKSNVFRPPNPWLMDIIHLLIEIYHHAELKLNQKFEIEVLCKELSLDHKTIEPTGEILNRVIPVDDAGEIVAQDGLDSFEEMSLNSMAPSIPNTLSLHAVVPSIPDLGPNLTLPQTEVVDGSRLREIVLAAVTRALQDIIQPVVDRSVTIAAIATSQMIKKDFCTEPDENRMRSSAINMVKATAGSLALVTSKEPLRANFTNYLRNLANDLPNGLPEGVIIMCVNSNLDLASSVIEKHAEERAVPEIEALLEDEFESRRRHRMERGDQPFFDHLRVTRWGMTIPSPYKLSPGMQGLNPEQLAIYEDFPRQPRAALVSATPSHVPSASDATRSLANEVLHDQYSTLPSIPTPAETPSLPHLTTQAAQLQHYPQARAAMTNGRQPGLLDTRAYMESFSKLVLDLQRATADAREEHFKELPRHSVVLDLHDSFVQLIIKTHQASEELVMFAVEQLMHILLNQADDTLLIETSLHLVDAVRRVVGPAISQRIRASFHQQPGNMFLHLPLLLLLSGTDLVDWKNIDASLAAALEVRKDGSIEFFEQLLDLILLNDSPAALWADFIRSIDAAWTWILADPESPGLQRLKAKINASPSDLPSNLSQEETRAIQQDQMDYVFDEWVHLCNNRNASDTVGSVFVAQMISRRLIATRDDLMIFLRHSLEKSIDKCDQIIMMTNGNPGAEAWQGVEALAKLVVTFLKAQKSSGGSHSSIPQVLHSILALTELIMNHHQATRGEHFNQRAFFRFYSVLLHEIDSDSDQFTEADREGMFLRFASRLLNLGPVFYPGFLFAWIALASHRVLLPALMRMHEGRVTYTKILKQALAYLGDQSKFPDGSPISKDLCQVIMKLFAILSHDYPDYIATNYVELCLSIPPFYAQLLNLILGTTPESVSKMPDPTEPGLIIDAIPEVHETPSSADDPSAYLREAGLLDILSQALEHGPTEDAVAQITHAINKPDGVTTTFGFVPVKGDVKLIYAVTTYIGQFAATRAASQGPSSNPFASGSSDIKTLFMLVLESGPEARYYLLSSMVNQLRYANSITWYFSQALVDIFTHDVEDPEEDAIREQIVRILLERLCGVWAMPWGLILTVVGLLRSDKVNFLELDWVKGTPYVSSPPPSQDSAMDRY